MKYEIEVEWANPMLEKQTYVLESEADEEVSFRQGTDDRQVGLEFTVMDGGRTEVVDAIYLNLNEVRSYRVRNMDLAHAAVAA